MRRRLAWGGAGAAVLLLGVAAVLSVGTGSVEHGSPVMDVVLGAVTLAFPVTGAIIASRRPRNPVGWLFIAFGVAEELGIAAKEYALRGFVVAPGSLPGPAYAGWLQENLLGPGTLLLVVFALFLFPTGHLPSPRWRVAAWAYVVVGAGASLLWALTPGPLLEQAVEASNPVGVAALGPVMNVLDPVLIVGLQVAPLLAIAAAAARFRRSAGVERQQMKWLASSVVVVALAVFSAPPLLEGSAAGILPMVLTSALATVPVACGVAILRYRLYDIDRIISRTVAYAAVTGLLGAIYAGLVFLLGFVVRPIGGSNDLAIAGSVLAVAALFRPVRRRVQSGIDRRFDRARYDAAQTIEAFGARLRDEIDIDAVGAELERVATETLQPSFASVWLRRQR